MNDLAIGTLPSPEEHQQTLRKMARVEAENRDLKRQLEWFQKHVFGSTSERRVVDPPQQTHFKDALGDPPETPAEPESQTVTYERRVGSGKKRSEDDVNDSGIRFTADVPVQVIEEMPAELLGPDADQYEVIGTKITQRIAQRTISHVILQFERPVLKRKTDKQIITPPAPEAVLERSVADVSFLAGLLIDKFQYHLPLYRQHQRLTLGGITLSRSTLTNLCKRSIELLRPIVEAQLEHVLQSQVLAMDETSIKASRDGPGQSRSGQSRPGQSQPGKMKQCWVWPVYGDHDEVVFTFANTRGRRHIEQVLKQDFKGTLLTDGYAAYASYQKKVNQNLTQAQCWVHTRRTLLKAEKDEPEAVARALQMIAGLYHLEEQMRQKKLAGEKKRQYRLTHSKPLVDEFFAFCQEQLRRMDLVPSDPWMQGLNYALKREHELRVFLVDPDVAMDTNHVEREIRPIPQGRKNWMFCWTELGAEHLCLIQSLISTCKLHDINPTTYLVDVLQRVSQHPARDVIKLTPRIWKDKFAHNPLRSVVDQIAARGTTQGIADAH